jgi:hypothetical protein
MAEQRNPYRGPRPWLRLGFKAPDGSTHRFDLVVDTGSPAGLIIRSDLMTLLTHRALRSRSSNFGELTGGWLRLYAPELAVVEFAIGYGNDRAAEIVARSHPEFVGIIGLPLLRIGEYGGNATDFWFRYPPTTPTTSAP